MLLSNDDEDCVTENIAFFLLIQIFFVTSGLLHTKYEQKKSQYGCNLQTVRDDKLVYFFPTSFFTIQLVCTKCISFLKPLCICN